MIKLALGLLLATPIMYEEEIPSVEISEEVSVEDTQEEFNNEVKGTLEKYLTKETAMKVFQLLVDTGILSFAFSLLIKAKKVRETKVSDIEEKLLNVLKEKFDKFEDEKIMKVVEIVKNLDKSVETMQKVLILSQDNTAKGKIALMEYLSTKTDSIEVKEAIKDVKETIELSQKVEEEVKEKVAGDYKEIF